MVKYEDFHSSPLLAFPGISDHGRISVDEWPERRGTGQQEVSHQSFEVTMQYILSATPLFAVLAGITMTSFYGYLLFHSLSEVFSVVIACTIFMVVWNARRLLQNHYLLFVGIAYLYVGVVDFLHTLAFKGMGVFQGYGADLATQLCAQPAGGFSPPRSA